MPAPSKAQCRRHQGNGSFLTKLSTETWVVTFIGRADCHGFGFPRKKNSFYSNLEQPLKLMNSLEKIPEFFTDSGKTGPI